MFFSFFVVKKLQQHLAPVNYQSTDIEAVIYSPNITNEKKKKKENKMFCKDWLFFLMILFFFVFYFLCLNCFFFSRNNWMIFCLCVILFVNPVDFIYGSVANNSTLKSFREKHHFRNTFKSLPHMNIGKNKCFVQLTARTITNIFLDIF